MRQKTKIWLIIAASLILVGCVLLGSAMKALKWDFTGLSTVRYETSAYEIPENYKNISIVTDTANIVFVASENAKGSVVCYEQENAAHSVAVKDGTLIIEIADTRKWYEHIGIFFTEPTITVYTPQGEYGALCVTSDTGDVRIPENFGFESIAISVSTGNVVCLASSSGRIELSTSTGNIRVENVSAEALALSVSTGEVIAQSIACEGDIRITVSTGHTKLADLTCKNLTTTGSTGDISLKNVIAAEGFSIERSTGDVRLDGCDAAEMRIKTSTGSVNGSLLSDKEFMIQTDTGSIDVPETATGGRCEITTDTGDIRINIQQ